MKFRFARPFYFTKVTVHYYCNTTTFWSANVHFRNKHNSIKTHFGTPECPEDHRRRSLTLSFTSRGTEHTLFCRITRNKFSTVLFTEVEFFDDTLPSKHSTNFTCTIIIVITLLRDTDHVIQFNGLLEKCRDDLRFDRNFSHGPASLAELWRVTSFPSVCCHMIPYGNC